MTQPARPTSLVAQSLALGVLAGVAGLLAGGKTLGGLFAGAILCTLIVPPLTVARSPRQGLLGTLLLAAGVMMVWLWLAGQEILALHACSSMACLLSMLLVSQWAVLRLFLTAHWSRPTAAALAALFLFSWLAAPIWLFPLCTHHPELVQRLAAVHPLFAINGVAGLENWTEMGIAYGLMDLNQDVPFALPASVLPSLLLHALVALPAALWTLWCRRNCVRNESVRAN